MGKPQVRLPVRLPPTAMFKNFAPAILNASQSTGLGASSDRLDSWKEIASYLRREVRTVQLWEKREGLPVHRHFHRSLSSVFALRSEVDAWSQRVSRTSVDPQDKPDARTDANPNSARRIQERVTVAVLPFHAPRCTPELERFNEGVVSEIIVAIG